MQEYVCLSNDISKRCGVLIIFIKVKMNKDDTKCKVYLIEIELKAMFLLGGLK